MKAQSLIHNISIATFLFLSVNAFSQNSRLKYADKMYANKGYYYASQGYEDVLERKVDSSVVSSKIADSYDKIGDNQKALSWYRYMQAKGTINQEQMERLALLERQAGNYEVSKEYFQAITAKNNSNDISKAVLEATTTEDELINRNWFDLIQQAINSSASDMSAIYFKEGKVLFASAKRKTKAINRQQAWTGGYFYDLYVGHVDEKGVISSKKVKLLSKGNSKYNDGPATFNPKTEIVYFTRNRGFEKVDGQKKTVANLSIYSGKLVKGKLKDIKPLAINTKGSSTVHPSVSKDGKTLYFSSNRPGGKGGMDLYSVALDEQGNSVGEPQNLGDKINTSGDEVFPFYSSKDNTLYFSSNGHFGLGGLDVFGVQLNDGAINGNIINLGSPINSSSDDFAFVSDENSPKGFVTSNREKGKGLDDIYGFAQKQPLKREITLKGTVFDEANEKPLAKAVVYLVDSRQIILDSIESNETGDYSFNQTDLEGDYKIVCSKDKYVKKVEDLLVDKNATTLEKNVHVTPVLDFRIKSKIVDSENKEPLSNVKVTLIDSEYGEVINEKEHTSQEIYLSNVMSNKYNSKIDLTVKFEKQGYEPKELKINSILTHDDTLAADVQLKKVVLAKNEPVKKVEKPIEVRKEIKVEKPIIEGKTDLKEVATINNIYYDLNSSYLNAEAIQELDKVVAIMNANPTMVIEVRAHTDCRQTETYNKWLSNRRAQRAVEYIQNHVSNGASRVSGKGFGKSQLLINCGCDDDRGGASPCTEEQHLQNRRTEFIVIKK
jgi:outer membrane protein OmpA-like peptidoglycan-associated protein